MRILLILPFTLLLCSCTVSKPIIVIPSDNLLEDCIINPPPVLSGNDAKDKLVLASAWANQTSNLGKCSKQIKLLQTWKKTQQERFGEK